jgi:hypothetical protein
LHSERDTGSASNFGGQVDTTGILIVIGVTSSPDAGKRRV